MYSLSKDGALFIWRYDDEEEKWYLDEKHFFFQYSRLFSAQFHKESNLLVVGFANGFYSLISLMKRIFGTYEVPTFTEIHRLSISKKKISAVAINPTGEWLAFGVPRYGQLLVWEWRSERYIMKQQGHFFETNALAYEPQGRYLATAGNDSKIKIWKIEDGFCFVTFTGLRCPIF